MFKLFFVIFVGLCGCYAKRNFEVQLTRFEVNPDSDPAWMDKGTVRVTKKSRNEFVVSGIFYVYKNVGNDGLAFLNLYQIESVGKPVLIYGKKAKFCDFLKSEKMMYPSLVKASNLPSPDQCPFPKGNYTITDYTIDEEKLPSNVPTGEYTGNVVYKIDNKLCFAYDFDFTVSAV